jgi:hypothetical protein
MENDWQSNLEKLLNKSGLFTLELFYKQLNECSEKWTKTVSLFEGLKAKNSFSDKIVTIIIEFKYLSPNGLSFPLLFIELSYNINLRNELILNINSFIKETHLDKEKHNDVKYEYNVYNLIQKEDFILNCLYQILEEQIPNVNAIIE